MDDCGAPKYFNAHSLSRSSAVSSVWPQKRRHARLHSQHCTGVRPEREDSGGRGRGRERERASGRRFHSWPTDSNSLCYGLPSRFLNMTPPPHLLPLPSCPAVSLYELSRASRTFMICCLMTFVASPALGIKYLRGERDGNKTLEGEETLENRKVTFDLNIIFKKKSRSLNRTE